MVYELSNNITKTLITHLRDEKNDAIRIRHTIAELSKQLIYEALKDFPLKQISIATFRGQNRFPVVDEANIVVVTILRAGMPMLEGAMELLATASAGFLGMKRDETTHKSVLYYERLPNCKGKTVLLVDPMLATGGSMKDAIELLKSKKPHKIIALNIIGAPEGVQALQSAHPDVDIYISQIEEGLDKDKFIIPGLGDAGDRSYNTL